MSKELCVADSLRLELFYEKSIRRLRKSPTRAESEIKERLTDLLDEFCGDTIMGFDMEEWEEYQMGINTTDKAKMALEMYCVLEEMIIAKHEKDNRLRLHNREVYHQRDNRFLEIVKGWSEDIKAIPSMEEEHPRAKIYFPRAIEAGYMEKTETGYRWLYGGQKGSKARLAYFLERVYCSTPTDRITAGQWRQLELLFGVVRLDRSAQQNADTGKTKAVEIWRSAINKLFD